MPTSTEDDLVAITNAREHLDGQEAQLAEAARVRTEARRAAKIQLAKLTAEAAVDEADARWQECLDVLTTARGQWETLTRRAYVHREIDAMRAVLAQARALQAELGARLADRQAVAAALGCADSGAHPAAAALVFVQALEAHLRRLDPPPPAPTPPPPPGQVRVHAIVEFQDMSEHWRHQVGTVVTLPAAEASQCIEKGWAVPVEA